MTTFDCYPHARLNETKGTIMRKAYDFAKGKRGAVVKQKGKLRITIYIDDDVLEAFRERGDNAGKGYQTMINEALRDYLGKSTQVLDEDTLRRVIREEIKKTG